MGGAVGRGHHLLPAVLHVLLLLAMAVIGRGGLVAAVPTTEVGACLALAAKVG